jgi:hypothetical protein
MAVSYGRVHNSRFSGQLLPSLEKPRDQEMIDNLGQEKLLGRVLKDFGRIFLVDHLSGQDGK